MEVNGLERLIHESLEQRGWKADAHEIAKKVKRLNYGLPLDDEFSVLCGWLGGCKLIHKLDQQQYPDSSRSELQVPDLLAVFEHNGSDVTVLIEVKSSKKNVMSFRPEYREKLKEFAHMALTKILNFQSSLQDTAIQWRGILGDGKSMASISNFRAGISENLEKKVVHQYFPIQK